MSGEDEVMCIFHSKYVLWAGFGQMTSRGPFQNRIFYVLMSDVSTKGISMDETMWNHASGIFADNDMHECKKKNKPKTPQHTFMGVQKAHRPCSLI